MKKFVFILIAAVIVSAGAGYLGANLTQPKAETPVVIDGTEFKGFPEIEALFATSEELYFPEKSPEFRIHNLQKMYNAESAEIHGLVDPGPVPEMRESISAVKYPLKDIDFLSYGDEYVIMIQDIGEEYTYISCDNRLMEQCKEQVFVYAPYPSSTADFFIPVYKNGFHLTGAATYEMHLSDLGGTFKEIDWSNSPSEDTVAAQYYLTRAGVDIIVDVPDDYEQPEGEERYDFTEVSDIFSEYLGLGREDFRVQGTILSEAPKNSYKITIYSSKEYYDNFDRNIFEESDFFSLYEVKEYKPQKFNGIRYYNLIKDSGSSPE